MRRRRLDRRRNTGRTPPWRRRHWPSASVSGAGEGGTEERAIEVRAEVRLRSAGSPLIDQDKIAARRIGGAGLMVGVDSEGTARAAADVDDRLGERGLLRAHHDDDG